jgi:SAM-dependent methyltransferase
MTAVRNEAVLGASDGARWENVAWLENGVPAADEPGFSLTITGFFSFRELLFVGFRCRHDGVALSSWFVAFDTAVFVNPKAVEAGQDLEFDSHIDIPPGANSNIRLGFELANGAKLVIDHPSNGELWRQSGTQDFAQFSNLVRAMGPDASVLEIGARARSGTTNRGFVPANTRYVGFDIKEGENVVVVGDAHLLSTHFGRETFDAVYSIAVFEHLLMPWKVAVEMNRVMKTGGVGYIMSHQTFPLHEEPWDFWRFSNTGWQALFNRFTGFEIIETGLSGRAYVASEELSVLTYRMDQAPAYLLSHVLFRKIGSSSVDWPVDVAQLLTTNYPH